jgi:hypothetical protein
MACEAAAVSKDPAVLKVRAAEVVGKVWMDPRKALAEVLALDAPEVPVALMDPAPGRIAARVVERKVAAPMALRARMAVQVSTAHRQPKAPTANAPARPGSMTSSPTDSSSNPSNSKLTDLARSIRVPT